MDSESELRDSEDRDDSPTTGDLLAQAKSIDALDIFEQKNLISLYELHYWRHPEVYPTLTHINSEFGTEFTQEQYDALLSDPNVIKRLRSRDVPLSAKEFKSRLTPKQLEWISILLDPYTRKSLNAKCKEAGMTWQKHNAWMRNPLFAQTVRDETNKLAADRRWEVLSGMVSEASAGNVQAAKIYLEWTGELKDEVNIRVTHEHKILIYRIIDVLQKHVDSDVLEAVATEIENVFTEPVPEKQALVPGTMRRGRKPQPTSTIEDWIK